MAPKSSLRLVESLLEATQLKCLVERGALCGCHPVPLVVSSEKNSEE